jgi:hypothetical protein
LSAISGVGDGDGRVTRWAVREQFSAITVSVARAEVDLAERVLRDRGSEEIEKNGNRR